MSAPPDAQVIVVGAGPAGASTAFSLAQAGIDVLLVDQAVFPRDKPCGDGVASSGLAGLERMGLVKKQKKCYNKAVGGHFDFVGYSTSKMTSGQIRDIMTTFVILPRRRGGT